MDETRETCPMMQSVPEVGLVSCQSRHSYGQRDVFFQPTMYYDYSFELGLLLLEYICFNSILFHCKFVLIAASVITNCHWQR